MEVKVLSEEIRVFPRVRRGAYREALKRRIEIAKETRTKVKTILRTGEGTILEPGVLFSELPPSLSLEVATPRRVAIKKNRYELYSKGPLGARFVKGKQT